MERDLVSFLEKFRNKRVGFLGVARTNIPLLRLFLQNSKEYNFGLVAFDNFISVDSLVAKRLQSCGVSVKLGKDCLNVLDVDILFRSPGVYALSKDLIRAKKLGIKITSEVEEFFESHPCKIIGITGSDGKTTTTTVISKILENAGHKVHVGGNIGNPLLNKIEIIQPSDYAVVELSSFQLISMKCSPDIAIFTNISQNHLDVHSSMEEYVSAKINILRYQSSSSLAVIEKNADKQYKISKHCKGKIYYFNLNILQDNFIAERSDSTKKLNVSNDLDDISEKKVCNSRLENLGKNLRKGTAIIGNSIYFIDKDKAEKIINVEDIKLKGNHNIKNCLAAICATRDIATKEAIVKTLENFAGVEHRMELVGVFNGVSYINDSIATTPTRTIQGALSFFDKKVVLIAGGYDKKVPFNELADKILSAVKILILFGETARTIFNAVSCAASKSKTSIKPEIIFVNSMEEAVKAAQSHSTSGDKVILSPACASFGMYRNFEERGIHFKELVRSQYMNSK